MHLQAHDHLEAVLDLYGAVIDGTEALPLDRKSEYDGVCAHYFHTGIMLFAEARVLWDRKQRVWIPVIDGTEALPLNRKSEYSMRCLWRALHTYAGWWV